MEVNKNCAEWLLALLSSQAVTISGQEIERAYHIKAWLDKIRRGELVLVEVQAPEEGQM